MVGWMSYKRYGFPSWGASGLKVHEEVLGGSRGHDADDHVDDGVGRCWWG